ncbi:MAG: type II toxin-antitoxin system VapC family toxin [Candidatus Portnoybacteria bacterium]|nr:type II toxin-antitoxin system VapC family toxin [Candidatus Portnoybacteria bacterium]
MTILDANVWVAFFYKDDALHTKAEKIFQLCERPVVMPEYVILEVSSVLSRKAGKKIADGFLELVMNSKDIEVLFSQDQFFIEVVEFFKRRPEENLSFVDAALLYLSKSYQIITFDKSLQKAMA